MNNTKHRGTEKNLTVVSAEDAGLKRGAWEMLQNPKLLSIYARHYKWDISNCNGVLATAKRLPLLGIMRAQVFSPETHGGEHWWRELSTLQAGEISVMTNRAHALLPPDHHSDTDLYSLVVDLRTDVDTLLSRCEKRCRKAIRSGVNAGIIIKESNSPKELADFHGICMKVSNSGTLYRVPPLELLNELIATGFGRVYVSILHGKIIGGVFLLADHYAHGLVSGFDLEASGGVSSNLLYWETLKNELARGTPFVDLGAQSLDENPQLVLFKRSFSPLLIPAYKYTLHPSPLRHGLLKIRNRIKSR